MKISKSIILPIIDKIESFEEVEDILKRLTDAIKDHNLVNYDDEMELHGAEPRFFSTETWKKLVESWEHNWGTLPNDGHKPDDDADVTEDNTALDIINLPAVPSGQPGLFADDSHLGYHDGTNWKVYIDNTGKFYFKGGDYGLIQWDGLTLDITGNIKVGGFDTKQEIYFKDSQMYLYDHFDGNNQIIAIRRTASSQDYFRFYRIIGGKESRLEVLSVGTHRTQLKNINDLGRGFTELVSLSGGYALRFNMFCNADVNRRFKIFSTGQLGLPNLTSDPTIDLETGQLAVVNNVLRFYNGTSWSNV